MEVTENIDLGKETNLTDIDKNVYFEWLVNYIEDGGEIDEYRDYKFEENEWYYSDDYNSIPDECNIILDEIDIEFNDTTNIFNLYDYTCTGNVPIYKDMLVEFAERYPIYTLELSKKFPDMDVQYEPEYESPEAVVNQYVEDELTVNGESIGYTREADIDFWETVRKDDYLEVMYQHRCDLCDWRGEEEYNIDDLESHNHKEVIETNTHKVRKVKLICTDKSNIYPNGYYTKSEFYDMIRDYYPESDIQFPFTKIENGKLKYAKPKKEGNYIVTNDKYIYSVDIEYMKRNITMEYYGREKSFNNSKSCMLNTYGDSCERETLGETVYRYMMSRKYPKELVKDYLDADKLTYEDIKKVDFEDISNYTYEYQVDDDIPYKIIQYTSISIILLLFLGIIFSMIIWSLVLSALASVFPAVMLYIRSYNINVVEKRKRILLHSLKLYTYH